MQNSLMKKFFILFVLILSTFHLYAESVNIKFFLQTGEILEKEINANTRLLQINDNFFPESKLNDDFLIVDIEGLEDLSQLKILQINDVNNIDDFAFLSRLINLQELYINSSFIKSLKFLEGMQNLNIIDLTLYVMEDNIQSFKNEILDLDNLKLIQKIDIHVSVVIDEDHLTDFNDIPKFINVHNQPILDISKNQLYTISLEQKEYLYQYSQIFLWPNPIVDDLLQIESLKDLNIVLK